MLRSNEIKKLLGRPVVHVFVDSGDLFASFESNEKEYGHILNNPTHGASSFMNFCRAIGDVHSSTVFDDEWPFEKKVWSDKGFRCVDVSLDSNGDSRVMALFTLKVHEVAVAAKGLTTLVLIAGGTDYTELLRSVKGMGVRTVLVGVDMSNTMIQLADVWAPVHDVVRDVSRITDDGARSYDWAEFVKLMHSLENSKLNFVGIRYFIREMLPSIGISDPSQKHVMVETAESLGIIEIYQEENKKGKSHKPVKACKLIRTNPLVQEVLGADA